MFHIRQFQWIVGLKKNYGTLEHLEDLFISAWTGKTIVATCQKGDYLMILLLSRFHGVDLEVSHVLAG